MIVVTNLPKIQCIYKIYNILYPEKFYIGSTENLQRRVRSHLNCIDRRKHYNKKLENSFYKYGKENFKLQILQVCKNIDKTRLLEIEQYWLDLLKPYYNLSIKATCTIASEEGVKIRADKIRRKCRSDNTTGSANVHFNKHLNLYIVKIGYNNKELYLGAFKYLYQAENRIKYLNKFSIEEIYEKYIMQKEQKNKLKEERLQAKLAKQKQKEITDAFKEFRKECKSVKNYLYWKRQDEKRTSKYSYVSFSKNRNKYICQFRHEKQYHYLGYFATELEAAITYNKYIADNNLNRPLIVLENE